MSNEKSLAKAYKDLYVTITQSQLSQLGLPAIPQYIEPVGEPYIVDGATCVLGWLSDELWVFTLNKHEACWKTLKRLAVRDLGGFDALGKL